MITIGYSTRSHKPEFIEYLKSAAGHPKVQIIEKVNNGEKSLSQVYNEIIEESEFEIVVLCHDDIYFDSKKFALKIEKHFSKSDYGILGVAGTPEMPKSGMWWEGRRMLGVVNHEHEGRKWENKYSDDLGNQIRTAAVVDGLFIALHKKRISKTFDETVDGFHFYDINFSFRNLLDGVKIGVIFDVRVTHLSIGMTNESWEKNKQIFAEKYKDYLPKRVEIREDEKLKILISCLSFRTFTGSEMYVYELSKKLKSLGHDVTVCSEIGGPLTLKANNEGIKTVSIKEPPGFKLGDGKSVIQTPQGSYVSQINQLYFVKDTNFDLIITQHTPIARYMCQLYPSIDKINIIHSEKAIRSATEMLEEPFIHESIRKYVAIRPPIKDHLMNKFSIDESKIDVVYNPFDENRFNTKNTSDNGYTLFVGTIDYLRKEMLFDITEQTKNEGRDLYLVGADHGNYLSDLLKYDHVKKFDPVYDIEKFTKKCHNTVGILLGRTTIEGWMCGKPGWIYYVDDDGYILNKEYTEPNYESVKCDISKLLKL